MRNTTLQMLAITLILAVVSIAVAQAAIANDVQIYSLTGTWRF